jgi:hypothetical protein
LADRITAGDYSVTAIMQDQEAAATLGLKAGDGGRSLSCRIALPAELDLVDQPGCRASMARGCQDTSLSGKREFTYVA